MNQISSWEVALYTVLNFLPYMPFVLYPFVDQFRFSKRMSNFILFLLTLVQIVNNYAVVNGFSQTWSTVFTMVSSLLVLLILVKGKQARCFMTLMMVQNLAILIRFIAQYVDSILFYDGMNQPYQWTESICLIATQIPILALFWKFLKESYIPAIRKNHSKKIWRFAWMVPMTFFVIWETFISTYPDFGSYNLGIRSYIMFVLIIISVGSFVIYYITILLLNEEVKTESYSEQFKSMKGRIQDARRARHDVRHHLLMIRAYLEEGKYEELGEYLNKYEGSMPLEDALVYCEHFETNALFTYFVQQAKELGVHYSVAVNYPEQLPISEEDLTIVFGNLLENALQACREGLQTKADFAAEIQVKGNYDGAILSFSVMNSCAHYARMDAEGRFISSKHEGNGIGIESVRGIVEKHGGRMKINQENGRFIVNLVMQG